MTLKKTTRMLWLFAATFMWMSGVAWAQATNPAVLVIDVSVNAALSVKVDGAASSTRTATVTPGGSSVVNTASTATVTSDATGINEHWKLSSANAPKKSDGSAGWSLVTSTAGAGAPSTNELAMQALFISSNAAVGDCGATIPASAWNAASAAPLSAAPQTYTTALFAEQTGIGGSDGDPDFTGAENGRMFPTSFRGMCFRVTPPSDVTFTDNVLAYVTITASGAP